MIQVRLQIKFFGLTATNWRRHRSLNKYSQRRLQKHCQIRPSKREQHEKQLSHRCHPKVGSPPCDVCFCNLRPSFKPAGWKKRSNWQPQHLAVAMYSCSGTRVGSWNPFECRATVPRYIKFTSAMMNLCAHANPATETLIFSNGSTFIIKQNELRHRGSGREGTRILWLPACHHINRK